MPSSKAWLRWLQHVAGTVPVLVATYWFMKSGSGSCGVVVLKVWNSLVAMVNWWFISDGVLCGG